MLCCQRCKERFLGEKGKATLCGTTSVNPTLIRSTATFQSEGMGFGNGPPSTVDKHASSVCFHLRKRSSTVNNGEGQVRESVWTLTSALVRPTCFLRVGRGRQLPQWKAGKRLLGGFTVATRYYKCHLGFRWTLSLMDSSFRVGCII